MSTRKAQEQREVTKAWNRWIALNEHAEALWARYEGPFIDLIMAEKQRSEASGLFPEPDIDFEDDIPF